MRRTRRNRRITIVLSTCACLMMGGVADAAVPAGAEAYRYRYVSLDNATPAGALFVDYFAVTSTRRVYGNAYTCAETCDTDIVVYRNGTITVLNHGLGYVANESGVVGGSVVTDPDAFIERAAIFDGTTVKLLPRRVNEHTSHVVKLTESGTALVESVDATTFASSFYLFTAGRTTPLALGSAQVAHLDVNSAGVVSGTRFGTANNDRAFRYRTPGGPLETLDPVPPEPRSWAQAINTKGDVLGYSFAAGGRERVGYWQGRTFVTSFVEGTPTYPTVSNRLLWNEAGLIVITRTSDDKSYIVPKPGLRLNLADLTTGLPAATTIVDVNNVGDMLGTGGSSPFSADHVFLLERSATTR